MAEEEGSPRDEERSPDSEQQQQRSDVDAMGQDKKRQVVGQGYGPSKKRQLAYYGIFLAIVVVAYLGFKVAVSELDKAPAKDADKAPWSKEAAGDQSGRELFSPPNREKPGVVRFQ